MLVAYRKESEEKYGHFLSEKKGGGAHTGHLEETSGVLFSDKEAKCDESESNRRQ